jgi:hypothetical protein
MATYSSSQVTNSIPLSHHGPGGNVKVAFADINCTAAPSTSDTINFFDLPAGARVLFAILESDDMDTNGTPTLTINVGDAGSATRYFSASTVGQAGTLSTAIATAGAGYSNTAKTRVVGVAGNNAATGAAGHLYLTMFYVLEGVAS